MRRQISDMPAKPTPEEVVSELRKKMVDAGFDEEYLREFFEDPSKINALIKSFQLAPASTGNDWEKITFLPGRSSNKIVYLVKINEDDARRFFLVSESTTGGAVFEFVGFDASEVFAQSDDSIRDELNDVDSVLDFINEHRLKVSSMIYPWNRVVSIENLFYKMNKK